MVSMDALRASELFQGLSDDELAIIARMAREETFEPEARIFSEGEPAESLYIVVRGRIAILIDLGQGRQTVVDTVGPGDSFGWSALVPPFVYTASAACAQAATVLVIPGDGLRELCQQHCRTAYAIMERVAGVISTRLSDTRLRLMNLPQGER